MLILFLLSPAMSRTFKAQSLNQDQLILGSSTYRDLIVNEMAGLLPKFIELCDSLEPLTAYPESMVAVRKYGQKLIEKYYAGDWSFAAGSKQLEQIGLEKKYAQRIVEWFETTKFTEYEHHVLVANGIIAKSSPYPLKPLVEFWKEVQFYDIKAGEVLADIGTGSGFFPLILVFAGLDVTWILTEIDPRLVGYMKEKSERFGNGPYPARIHFIEGQEKAIGLEEWKADKIFLRETFHHLRYPQDILSSIRLCLKPDGLVFVTEEVRDFDTNRKDSCKKMTTRSRLVDAFSLGGYHLIREDRSGEALMLCFSPGPGSQER